MRKGNRIRRALTALLAASMLLTSSSMTTFAESGTEGQNEETEIKEEAPVSSEEEAGETAAETTEDLKDSVSPEESETSGEQKVPEESTESGETEISLEGYVRLTDLQGQRSVLKEVEIRFYDADSYDPDSETNPVVAETEAAGDGFLKAEGLEPGNYRIEYISMDEEFRPGDYKASVLPEEAGYEVIMAEDEKAAEEAAGEPVKERDYFAVIPSLTLESGQELDLELEEKQGAETETIDETIETEENKETAGPEETGEMNGNIQTVEGNTQTEPEMEAEEPLRSSELTIAQLKDLDEETVGAAVEVASTAASYARILRMAEGSNWTFDTYYVGQGDNYYIEKTNDFSLKYQMEFHTSQDCPVGTVEIRIPAGLVTYRDGSYPVPSDIAVPQASPEEEPVDSRSTPFNYYLDGEELVFWNYRDIPAGTNAAWQVLYKGIDVMEIVDETRWSITPTIQVGEETVSSTPLTGRVNTQATLSSVSKTAYQASGKSYSPGLYTQKQVERYIGGSLPSKYAGENFGSYRYVVWNVTIKGNGTQPWSLEVKEHTNTEGGTAGEIVGWSLDDSQPPQDEYIEIEEQSKQSSWSRSFTVVTAYPVDQVPVGTALENQIDVRLTPYDGIDPVQEKSDSAAWSWQDYEWHYAGDDISISKSGDQTYEGWLEVYKYARQEGDDLGNFGFTTRSTTRGYDLTHVTENTPEGDVVGTYLEGSSYQVTTADDFLYAYAGNESADESAQLSDADYYFTSVSVTQSDSGYDVWEDETDAPETMEIEGRTQDLIVYAMYEDSAEWKEVATIPWDGSGRMSYTFTAEQLADRPWRVKAVHETINYSTTCQIDVTVRIRKDSPVLGKIIDSYEAGSLSSARLENLSGVMVESFLNGVSQGYHHGTTGSYQEPGLSEDTQKMYGTLLQRDNAYKTFTGLTPEADAGKTVRSSNNPAEARVDLTYTLTARDGYGIYGQEGVDYLKRAGVQSPGRNNVVFYDLLPYGVRFDPSRAVTAGRITSLGGSYQSQAGSWDRSQVTVTVDSENDIIENWRDTGRTMVIFHVEYSGAESAVYTSGNWMEGWGVSFGAYYDWKDLDIAQAGTNICAFMPEDEPGHPLYQKPLYGTEDQVAKDDGDIVPADLSGDYEPFQDGDLNRDRETQIRNVLYAKASSGGDMVIANESKVEKLVRADSDRFGVYNSAATVEEGGGYTYDITVTAGGTSLKDIVVFDRMENAAVDLRGNDKDPFYPFDGGTWQGTFQSVVTTGLTELGITAQIYYNASRNAPVPSGGQKPEEVLTAANGWYPAETFLQSHKAAEVQAVAVDLGSYILDPLEGVSFQIRMQAPEDVPEEQNYAYNNASFYSVQENTGVDTEAYVEGNSARVSLGREEILEVSKEFAGEIPSAVQENTFEIHLYEEVNGTIPFANKEYQLWKLENGEWVQETSRLYATDGSGILSLKAGEKAVFPEVPDAGRIVIEEEENPFWEPGVTDTETEENGRTVRKVTIANTYRPVLYAQKETQAVPEGVDVSGEAFTFQLSVKTGEGSYEPLPEAEFWYVDSVRTDGGIPNKVTSLGSRGEGQTDENGEFTIHPGEIIALFPGEIGVSYRLTEVDGYGEAEDNWLCMEDTAEGTVPVLGASASITNIYKWKDLLLTKSLTHQEPEECGQEFTFQVKKVEGETEVPVSGNEWVLLNADGSESTAEGEFGSLDADGNFTCACAGRTVKIKGLEAGETYTVTETKSGEFYRPVNSTVEAVMPIYSSSRSVEITNDYLKRPLSVTKIVTYDQTNAEEAEKVSGKTFTMTAEVKGDPLSDYPYTLTENGTVVEGTYQTDEGGQFILKNGQTATFEDAGVLGDDFRVTELQDSDYGQIYPADGEPHTGNLESEGSKVTFINGDTGGLVISKEYEAAEGDKAAKEYVDLMQNRSSSEGKSLRADASVSYHLEVTDEEGNSYIWPKKSLQVTIIDNLSGTVVGKTWPAGGSITVQPWKSILLEASDLEGIVSYTLSENKTDQHRIFEWREGQWMEISQKEPSGDQAIHGTLEDEPVAELINEATSIAFEGSEIEKRMTIGSGEVPEGAELTWRLERYDGTGWSPAEGVRYLTFDEMGPTCDRTLTTGTDGEILLTKTENGYPKVRFTEDRVYLNRYEEAQTGDLRLVEVRGSSDDSWGYLAGYGSKEDLYGYSLSLSSEEAVAFVNSNRNTPVEIEKQMETESEESFTMILEQVLSVSEQPVTQAEQILESVPGEGISYTIYDADTGTEIGTGTTGAKGEIILKAGQYARLDLPDGSLWTVTEEQKADHVLKNLSGTPEEKLTKLGDNLMLIQQRAEVIAGALEVQVKDNRVVTNEILDKENFIVNVIYSDGSKKQLTSEEFTLNPTKAASRQGPMDVTVHWTKGNMEDTVTLNVIGEIIITRDMVNTGVKNAVTGEDVNIKSGDVTIPEYIIWEGIEYRVVGIGREAYGSENATYANQKITGIHFPDSIEIIERNAFSNCKNLSGNIKWPKNLKNIEAYAFDSCYGLTGDLVIPNGITSISTGIFRYCEGFDGELIIPEGITSISSYAFEGCSNLTGTLILPTTLQTIGMRAFRSSGFTGNVIIPNGVRTIGEDVFKYTDFTSISVDNTRDAISGAPWGWSGGADAVVWLREE